MLKGLKWEILLESQFQEQPIPNLQKELFKTILASWQWDEACAFVGQSYIGPNMEEECCEVSSFNPRDMALQKLHDMQIMTSTARDKLKEAELLQKQVINILQLESSVPTPFWVPSTPVPVVTVPPSLIRKLPKSDIGKPLVKCIRIDPEYRRHHSYCHWTYFWHFLSASAFLQHRV